MTILSIIYRYRKAEILWGQSSALEKKIREHASVAKMNKKRLKVALVVLDAARVKFPETK